MSYDTELARVASQYAGPGKRPLSRHLAALVYILEGRTVVAHREIEARWEEIMGEDMAPLARASLLKRLRARGFRFRATYGLGIAMTGTPRGRYAPDEAGRALTLAREITERAAELAPLLERMTEKRGR